MKLIINKNYSITNKNIILESRVNKININIDFINEIFENINEDKIKSVIEYYSFLSILNIREDNNINYSLILGKKRSKEYLDYLKNKIEFFYSIFNEEYFLNIFNKRIKLFKNLSPDLKLNNEILLKPTYNHKSNTGRTSINSGFNYLTMKKELRYELKTNKKNEVLFEIDFKSCEPFFYLKSKNLLSKNILEIKDVYNFISDSVNINLLDRDRFKRGILSIIYGATDETISSISGLKKDKVLEIKKFFDIENFKNQLENEFSKNNVINNFYGRPITKNSNLVNYWIQSSAVDYCGLSFEKFIESYKNIITPCFFIHDSFVFSTDKENIEKFKNIEYLSDDISGISIPVTIKYW